MKRFLLFSYPEYYPSGGLGDVLHEFDSLEVQPFVDALIYGLSESAYVFDCEKREIVKDYSIE